MANEIKDILNMSYKRDEIMEKLYEHVTNIEKTKGYEALTKIEINIYHVGVLEEDLNIRGFGQYFKHTKGKYVNETLAFLQEIEAFNLYYLLDGAYKIFASTFSEEDKMDEYAELDEEYFELDEEMWEYYGKCIKYFKNNIS